MVKKIIVLFFCFCTLVAGAQVTVDKNHIIGSGIGSMISIRVLDAATDQTLSNAHIKLIFAPGDTVAMATDIYGTISYFKKFPKDSLSMVISHVGYKTIYHKYKPEGRYILLTARLLEDTINMNAIIIKGDRIAMVLRGDTIFYNASAFKTMRGDNMEELLKRLPGVEFREGRFYANGEPVKRILINGTELFGTNTKAAGELIRADEVKNVKVYDYYSDESRRTGDTLDAKERVLDVTTHKKIEVVKQTYLGGSAGVYIDKNEHGNRDRLYNLSVNRQQYKVGQSFLSQVDYSKNSSVQRSGYSENWQGLLSWYTPHDKKINFFTSTDFYDKTTDTYSSTNKDYFASPAYNTRNYSSDILQKSFDRNFSSKNTLGYKINNHNQIMFSVNAVYIKNRVTNDNKSISTTDGLPPESINMHRYDTKNSIGISNGLNYRHFFKNAGNSIELTASYLFENNDGNGWNVDTAASSIKRAFLENDMKGRNRTYGFTANYSILVAKKAYLNLLYTLNHNTNKSQRTATDILIGAIDTLNTYDYTLQDLTHQGKVYIGSRGEKMSLSGSISFQFLDQKRDEVFPEKYIYSKTFNHILLQFDFSYNLPLSRLDIKYSENNLPLSVEELRGVIENSNPLFLKAGNPNLKQSVTRNLKIMYNLTSIMSASSWNFELEGSIVSDYSATKTRYFNQPTELPEYNYTAEAGTTLETKENVKGMRGLNATIDYSKNSSLLESTLRINVRYRYDRTPFLVSEKPDATDAQDLSATLYFQSGFSQFIELHLSSTAGSSYSEDNNNHIYKSFRRGGTASVRVNFLKRCWATGSARYNYINYISSKYTREETTLNAAFLYKFGKNDRGEFGLHLNDILNQARSINIKMQQDYIETFKNRTLGRNGSVSFSYKF